MPNKKSPTKGAGTARRPKKTPAASAADATTTTTTADAGPRTGTARALAATSARDATRPVFFFKPNEPFGEFCQWYPATFSASKADMSALVGRAIDPADPEGWQPLYFHCAEQFMMYCKAGCFGDAETQRRILATDDAKEQKRLGRATRGFDAAVWDRVKSDVVVLGNLCKFGQNKALRALLLATGDRVLAEAASEDRVWGIGFTAQEARTHADTARWGENRLGKALMEVRARLARELAEEAEEEKEAAEAQPESDA